MDLFTLLRQYACLDLAVFLFGISCMGSLPLAFAEANLDPTSLLRSLARLDFALSVVDLADLELFPFLRNTG